VASQRRIFGLPDKAESRRHQSMKHLIRQIISSLLLPIVLYVQRFSPVLFCQVSRDSSVSIASRQHTGRLRTRVVFAAELNKTLHIPHSVLTTFGAHRASHVRVPGALCPGVERPGPEADRSCLLLIFLVLVGKCRNSNLFRQRQLSPDLFQTDNSSVILTPDAI
jgi:hypothetical protein